MDHIVNQKQHDENNKQEILLEKQKKSLIENNITKSNDFQDAVREANSIPVALRNKIAELWLNDRDF